MTLLKPGEDSFSRSFEEEFEQMRMVFEEVPKVVRDGKGDMVILNIG